METCKRFAKMDKQFVVQNSYVQNQLLLKAILASDVEMENILRMDTRIEDDIPNCGHCNHTNRSFVKECFESLHEYGTCRGRKRLEYICQDCMTRRVCPCCDRYGMYY